MRLDQYLHQQYPQHSRSTLQKLIRDGQVIVNGISQTKSGYVLSSDSDVNVKFSQIEQPVKKIELPIIYEDSDCVVVEKPAGLLTHSKGAFNPEATVATWLSGRPDFKFVPESGNKRAGIVHRLDRGTSGVMICAKNEVALKHLQKQFHDRKVKKTYIARIEGRIEPQQAIIDLPIERNPKQPQRFRVGHNGKSAITEYKVIDSINMGDITDDIIELKPQTGRTHQLRVHLNYLKHPIVGDEFYDGRQASRLYLHASELEITTPNKERNIFKSKLPSAFTSRDIK